MVKGHAGIAFNGFHGRFVDDILDMGLDIRLLFQAEHFGEHLHIPFLEDVHIAVQQFGPVGKQFGKKQGVEPEGRFPAGYLCLAWCQ